MRMPAIARAITNCWISEVPSKMVWIFALLQNNHRKLALPSDKSRLQGRPASENVVLADHSCPHFDQ